MIAPDTNTDIMSIPIIQLMNNEVPQDLLKTILEEVLSLCRQTFKTRLVSVVLFGSYAQGTASPESDIDLLVIVQQLPADPEPQEKLLDSIEIPILKKYHRCVSVILATPEAVQNEVNRENPLFFGIWTGYSVLLDSGDFFRNCMEIVRHHIQRSKPVFIDGRRRWNLAEI
jgi:hypothetical protein